MEIEERVNERVGERGGGGGAGEVDRDCTARGFYVLEIAFSTNDGKFVNSIEYKIVYNWNIR